MTNTIQASSFEPLNTEQPQPTGGGNPIRWVALAIAGVFVIIMGFLFTAKSLQINVASITPADISLSGGLMIPFGGRYLLRPGDYSAVASAPGYHSLSSDITVSDKDSQIVELVLQPLPGKLSVNSQPAGARVLLDTALLGETPFIDLPVEAGEHTIELHAPRYLPLTQNIDITGREVQQKLSLVLEPAWAEITIDSKPPGATILVDG